jgi:hypothetical protein
MTIIHTELPVNHPGHYGEYKVGQILKNFSNPGLEIWFGVDYIAGVPELDLILSDKQAGLYLIEIKSMAIDSITDFSQSSFTVGRETKSHPISQIRTGSIKLREHLKRSQSTFDRLKIPFIQTTICWSEISRSQWKNRFTDPTINSLGDMCIFKEDLISYEALIGSLQRLWEYPALGITTPMHARTEHGDMEAFRKALLPSQHKINISKSLENEIVRPSRESTKITDKYEVAKTYRVSIQGAPGTGKTTFLRQIALKNLSAGAKVLHVCFNKVLAADQKREFQILREKKEEYGFIDVFSFWALFKELGHFGGFDRWDNVLNNVTNYLNSEEGKTFIKYDVILIDESQDLPEYFFKVVELIARPSASWFIAYGKGQETYNFSQKESHPSKWLSDYLAKSEVILRKRSFRNSTRMFLIAQAIWEKYPDITKAKDWVADKLLKKTLSDEQLELNLDLPKSSNDLRIEILPVGSKREIFIKYLVLTALEEAKDADRGGDLLVAVIKPSSQKNENGDLLIHSEYELVKKVLEDVANRLDLDFLDLVPDDTRDVVPKNGAIRLVTLQSIRGLSASHAIVFDLPQLENWLQIESAAIKPPLVNLAYIALSRSRCSTIVVLDGVKNSEFEKFLLSLLEHYQEVALTDVETKSE